MNNGELKQVLKTDLAGIEGYMKFETNMQDVRYAREQAIAIEYYIMILDSEYTPKYYNSRNAGLRKLYI